MKLRNYSSSDKIHEFYKQLYSNQNYKNSMELKEKYQQFNKSELYMTEILLKLDEFVDPSDPDITVSNSIHAYQTAERIRLVYPQWTELQVTGLIHDFGKILFTYNEPIWNVVGDTFILGCPFPKSIVYYEDTKLNDDYNNNLFNSKPFGCYQPNCGLRNTVISYGHDEYLYDILKYNQYLHKLPEKYWEIIRFHSLYPWHTYGEYTELCDDTDNKLLEDVKLFNKFDLYSKEDVDFVLSAEIIDYYNQLLFDYFPIKLKL